MHEEGGWQEDVHKIRAKMSMAVFVGTSPPLSKTRSVAIKTRWTRLVCLRQGVSCALCTKRAKPLGGK